jgi:hypothetical protein
MRRFCWLIRIRSPRFTVCRALAPIYSPISSEVVLSLLVQFAFAKLSKRLQDYFEVIWVIFVFI